MLQRLKMEGLTLRLKKCFFGLQEMEYLGYTMSNGINPVSTKKLEVVRELDCAYNAEESLQLCAVLQLLREVHPSSYLSYASIDKLTMDVSTTEGYADACLFGSLRDAQVVTAQFRAMLDPSGGQFGRNTNRGNKCFDSGNCSGHVARTMRRISTSLLMDV
jgi:hypothetical protein